MARSHAQYLEGYAKNCELPRLKAAIEGMLEDRVSLLAILRSTLQALEAHLEDSAKEHGLSVHELCPCYENEVQQAKTALTKSEGGSW